MATECLETGSGAQPGSEATTASLGYATWSAAARPDGWPAALDASTGSGAPTLIDAIINHRAPVWLVVTPIGTAMASNSEAQAPQHVERLTGYGITHDGPVKKIRQEEIQS